MFAQRPVKRVELDEWEALGVATQEAIVRAFRSVRDDSGEQMCSVNFIYTHIIRDHFVGQILWLGPPGLQNTQVWERFHQTLKEYADAASMKHLQKSTMNQVSPFYLSLASQN